MSRSNRDDFSEKTKLQIAKRAGWLCSNPDCRKFTIGATSDGQGEINLGTASHICAAAPGGPRFEPSMAPADRASSENGLWLCRDHGTAVDSPDPQFTVELLKKWKRQAEDHSCRRVLQGQTFVDGQPYPKGPLSDRLLKAAQADLVARKRQVNLSPISIPLNIGIEGSLEVAATTDALIKAIPIIGDSKIVAGPGMGKTTTLMQIAEQLLLQGAAIPIVVALGDWVTENRTIRESVRKRAAFRDFSEDELLDAFDATNVVLLLDGWNELEGAAREAARVEVSNIKAEFPDLTLVVATRQQALDVPFGGRKIDVLPLDIEQQRAIATATSAEAPALLDQAWRTRDVRELITIPFYLTALLALPKGEPFPTTKEALLHHFVLAHEREASHAAALNSVLRGLQQDYLEALAVIMMSASTTITDRPARESVGAVQARLRDAHVIQPPLPQADQVLDTLVSNHVLVRSTDPAGFSFQHHQFQEWYSSHYVAARILKLSSDPSSRKALQLEILDLRNWEEPILFAVERLSRGSEHEATACAKAIDAAFEVDPMLAAEMIYRSADAVWAMVRDEILKRIDQWHTPGTVDRALRFMMNSGRPEFISFIWPLIASLDQQTSLRSLRQHGERFRSSILGPDPVAKIQALPAEVRDRLLDELALSGEYDAIELATTVAKAEPDPEVQASVIQSLAFRRADRHVTEILKHAPDATFEIVARRNIVDDILEEVPRRRFEAARAKLAAADNSSYTKLQHALDAASDRDPDPELVDTIVELKFQGFQDNANHLIHEARGRFPKSIGEAVLRRALDGKQLPSGADSFVAAAGIVSDDDTLVEFVLSEPERRIDEGRQCVATALGSQSIGKVVDELLKMLPHLRDTDQKRRREVSESYFGLRDRIRFAIGDRLVEAVSSRSKSLDSREINELAELLRNHPVADRTSIRPVSFDAQQTIRALLADWAVRLRENAASREYTATIAGLARQAPSPVLLPILKDLLDDNLERLRKARADFAASGKKDQDALQEMRHPYTHEYFGAFLAINAPETFNLMREYLADPDFGEYAAQVLVQHWKEKNEPKLDDRFIRWPDFSLVAERRKALEAEYTASSAPADAIFAVVESLLSSSDDSSIKQAGIIAGIAAQIPCGERTGTVNKLLDATSRNVRAKLLTGLVLSGHVIPFDEVKRGLENTQEDAKVKAWMWDQNWDFREWVRLIPFTDKPSEAPSLLRSVYGEHRIDREVLEDIARSCNYAPGAEVERALFDLADAFPSLYGMRDWQDAVLGRKTASAVLAFSDAAGKNPDMVPSGDRYFLARKIGELMEAFPPIRDAAYRRLEQGDDNWSLLAAAVSESPDMTGVLLFLRLGIPVGYRMLEEAVTHKVRSPQWEGSYTLRPIDASELRRRLLADTTDGGAQDMAASYLSEIDRIRDESGPPEQERRHPDLRSGKPWPILRSVSTVH